MDETRGGTQVTVAIPTRDRPDSLCRVVADLWEGRRRPDEILVICQGARAPEVADRLRRDVPAAIPAVRFYASVRTGAGASWNDALHLASGDFLAFSDDDMRLPAGWLERMLVCWERDWDRGSVLLTGPIEAPRESENPHVVPGRRLGESRVIWRAAPTSGDVLYGGHFGAPRIVFERLGTPVFDERFGPGTRFPGALDEEFALRLLDAGVPVVFDPEIRAVHVAEPSTWVESLFTHSQGAGAMHVLRLQQRRPAALRALLRTTAGLVTRAIRSAARLRFRESAGWLASVVGMVLGALRWLTLAPPSAPTAVNGDALRRLPLDEG